MKHVALSTLEKQLINKLQEATDFLKFADGELDSLRQTNAKLKAKLQDAPNLPADFRASAITQQRLNETKAAYSEAKRQLQEEIDHYHTQVVHDISRRTTKALKEAEYQNALNSNYATATKAINARRNDINTNGVDVLVGYSGYTCKGEFDSQSNQLFTFENIGSYEDLEIDRQSYSIIKSELSPISAGNTYTLQPVRHSNR